jgi:iron complex transport system permease protein
VAEVERRYRRHALVRFFAIAIGLGLLLALALVALTLGSADIGPVEALRALGTIVGAGSDEYADPEAARKALIVLELRLPRVLMAMLAGAALAASGAVLQGLLRNVLVAPSIVGINSAAAFGASAVIVLGVSVAGFGAIAVVGAALVAALGCAGIVFSLSWFHQMRPATVILVGVALSFLFNAFMEILQFIATEEQIAEIVFWTFGSFNNATNREVLILLIMLALGLPWLLFKVGSLNAVAFGGDEVARGLGVNILRLRLICGVIAVAFAAVVVSFSGIIGFVGLVGPHIARFSIGADHRYLLPFSMVCGAFLLLGADTIGRNLFPVLIPVGIVVALLGVPLFLHLILSHRGEYF